MTNFKLGDRVKNYVEDEGTVVCVDLSLERPVRVAFDNGCVEFYLGNGHWCPGFDEPNEYSIEVVTE